VEGIGAARSACMARWAHFSSGALPAKNFTQTSGALDEDVLLQGCVGMNPLFAEIAAIAPVIAYDRDICHGGHPVGGRVGCAKDVCW
jgi:hypothetical protein